MIKYPHDYLSEIIEIFQCATSSFHEELVKLDFTRKKKSTTYREQNKKVEDFLFRVRRHNEENIALFLKF